MLLPQLDKLNVQAYKYEGYIARICDMAAKRLQLQERIGSDIAEIIQMASDTPDVAVLITANHSCMTARGIRKPSAKTVTTTFRGRFETESFLQDRFFRMLNQQ